MNTQNNYTRTLIAVLSLAGMIIMGYLLYMHYAPTPKEGTFCNIGEGFSCDIVNKSAYSEIFGIPMAALGVLYFGLVLILSLFFYGARSLSFIGLFLIVLLGPSLYLTAIGKSELGNFCIFCETSKVLMMIIAGLAINALGLRNIGFQKLMIAFALAFALAGLTYAVHSRVVLDPFTFETNISLKEIFIK